MQNPLPPSMMTRTTAFEQRFAVFLTHLIRDSHYVPDNSSTGAQAFVRFHFLDHDMRMEIEFTSMECAFSNYLLPLVKRAKRCGDITPDMDSKLRYNVAQLKLGLGLTTAAACGKFAARTALDNVIEILDETFADLDAAVATPAPDPAAAVEETNDGTVAEVKRKFEEMTVADADADVVLLAQDQKKKKNPDDYNDDGSTVIVVASAGGEDDTAAKQQQQLLHDKNLVDLYIKRRMRRVYSDRNFACIYFSSPTDKFMEMQYDEFVTVLRELGTFITLPRLLEDPGIYHDMLANLKVITKCTAGYSVAIDYALRDISTTLDRFAKLPPNVDWDAEHFRYYKLVSWSEDADCYTFHFISMTRSQCVHIKLDELVAVMTALSRVVTVSFMESYPDLADIIRGNVRLLLSTLLSLRSTAAFDKVRDVANTLFHFDIKTSNRVDRDWKGPAFVFRFSNLSREAICADLTNGDDDDVRFAASSDGLGGATHNELRALHSFAKRGSFYIPYHDPDHIYDYCALHMVSKLTVVTTILMAIKKALHANTGGVKSLSFELRELALQLLKMDTATDEDIYAFCTSINKEALAVLYPQAHPRVQVVCKYSQSKFLGMFTPSEEMAARYLHKCFDISDLLGQIDEIRKYM